MKSAVPYPHDHDIARTTNVARDHWFKIRCGQCGRRLYVSEGKSAFRCPWHGILQLKDLALPAKPRKRNIIHVSALTEEMFPPAQFEAKKRS